jgi:hypothetical protein
MESKFNIVYYALNNSIRRPLREHIDDIVRVLKKPHLGECIFRQVIHEGFEYYRDFYKAIFQEEAPSKVVTGRATYGGMNALFVMLHRTKVLSQVTSHPQCEVLEQVHMDSLVRIADRIRCQLEDGEEYQFHTSDESDEEDKEDEEKTEEESTFVKDKTDEEAEKSKKEEEI